MKENTRTCPTCKRRKTLASLARCPVCERWADDPAFSKAYISSGFQEPEGAAGKKGIHHVCTECGIGFYGQPDSKTCVVCKKEIQRIRDRERYRERYRRRQAEDILRFVALVLSVTLGTIGAIVMYDPVMSFTPEPYWSTWNYIDWERRYQGVRLPPVET